MKWKIKMEKIKLLILASINISGYCRRGMIIIIQINIQENFFFHIWILATHYRLTV